MNVEFFRKLPNGDLVPWSLRDPDAGDPDDLATDPVSDLVARQTLLLILSKLSDIFGEFGDLAVVSSAAPTHFLQDYEARTDDQPIYIGQAAPASPVDSAVWKVLKFRYEGSGDNARMLEFDTRVGIQWDNRADPTADGEPAWTF